MARAILVALLAACGEPAPAPTGSAFDVAPPPGVGGITLSVASAVVSGATVALEVTAPDLAPGDRVDFGWGPFEGDGVCPFRAQTGGSLCLELGGKLRSLGTGYAADEGGAVVARVSAPLTSSFRVVYVQAFLLRGANSATSNVVPVTVHQPWPDLDPRVDALEAALASANLVIGGIAYDISQITGDYLTADDLLTCATHTAINDAVTALEGADADAIERIEALEGLVSGDAPEFAASSCYALHADRPDLPTGTYWIDPDGGDTSNAFQASCDMTSDGGGWTKVVNIVGTSIAHGDNTGAYGDLTNPTQAAKLSDAQINALNTVGYFRYTCSTYVVWVNNTANTWTSARNNAYVWSVDRDRNGVFECAANRAGYVFSDYEGCIIGHSNYVATSTSEGYGCAVQGSGWGLNGGLWVR